MKAVLIVGIAATVGNCARHKHGVVHSEMSESYKVDRNVCPALAALQRAGQLNTDSNGNVEIMDIFDGLHNGLGIEKNLSLFQAFGIVGYPPEEKNKERSRDRCIPGVTARGNKCFRERYLGGKYSPENARYLNVLTMHGKQTVEHGISTGVRGGSANMPPGLAEKCNGKFPCEYLFQKFYVDNADRNGNFYIGDLMKIVCLARKIGDRGGEHSYRDGLMSQPLFPKHLKVVSAEWQMKGALTAMLGVFGRRDKSYRLYMTLDDMRAVVMEGRFPTGWKKRPHGCMIKGCEAPALTRWRSPVQCDMRNPTDVHWVGTGCTTAAGNSRCTQDSNCRVQGSFCMNGRCMCKRGTNGRQMCYKSGRCQEQSAGKGAEWWGSTKIVKANNPSAPGN